jgi:ribonuclease P protein component
LDFKSTFKKGERISLQKEMNILFGEGCSFCVFPLRVIYIEKKPASGFDISILINVPKKNFKHAVDRNRLKRLIREAYRLNKHVLQEAVNDKGTGLLIALLFVGKELVSYATIEAVMIRILNTLKDKVCPIS